MDLFKRMAFLFLFGITAFGAIKAVDLQFIDNGENQQPNPGFENGLARWSATGGALAIDTSTPLFGTRSATWDPSATAQELSNTASAVPAGMAGNKCQASFYFQAATFTTGEIKVQVEDGAGTALSSSLDLTQQANPVEANIFFDCPSSGNWHLVFESTADADSVEIDKVHLGLNKALYQVSQAAIVADVNIGGALVVLGSSSLSTYTEITNSGLDMVDNGSSVNVEIPCSATNPSTGLTCSAGDEGVGVVFDAEAAKYEVQCAFGHLGTTDSGESIVETFQLVETPNNAQTILQEGNTRVDSRPGQVTHAGALASGINYITINGVFDFTTGGQKTIRLMHESLITGTVTNSITSDRDPTAGQRDIRCTVKKFPVDSQATSIVQGERLTYVDVNVGGANSAFLSGASTYTEATSTGWDLVINTNDGGGTIEIPCSTTNASTGLTCSTGSESMGVVFDAKPLRRYRVCGQGTIDYRAQNVDDASIALQWVETPNNAQTILQEGNSRTNWGITNGGSASVEIMQAGFRSCGEFYFSSGGQKTLRLMYEGLFAGGTATGLFVADRLSTLGQRDFHIVIEELPTGVNHVVQLTQGKFETKLLSADVTTDTTMSDLTFNNLVVGGIYKAECQFRLRVNSGASDDEITVKAYNDSGTSNQLGNISVDTTSTSAGAYSYGWSSSPFEAVTTTLTFQTTSATANSHVQGNNDMNETWCTLTQLFGYEETTEF